MRFVWPVALLATLPALAAGCTDAETLSADARLTFSGSETGSHEETAQCGPDGELGGTGNMTEGQVSLRLAGPNGSELFERSFDEAFELEPQTVTGERGTWTLAATRSAGNGTGDAFRGEYTFHLSC